MREHAASVTHGLLPLAVAERLCEDLTHAAGPREALAHVEAARETVLGPGLLTVNVVSARPVQPGGAFQLQRAWSSHPVEYPVGGGKRKLPTPWTQQLLVRGEVFVGEGEGALAAAFDDATRILAMGLRSVINVPLQVGGECRATFNVLGPNARWSREQVVTVHLLALLAQPFVLQMAADVCAEGVPRAC